jgi:hypothetical protein
LEFGVNATKHAFGVNDVSHVTNIARALLTPACTIRGRIAALGMAGDVTPSEHPTSIKVLDAPYTPLYR